MISHCPAAGNSIHIGKAEESERGEKNHCCASNGQKCAQGEEGKGERCASGVRIFVRTRKFPQAIVYILAREVTRCGRISALLRCMARVFPLHKSKTPAFASVSGPLPEYYKGLRNQHRMGKFAFGLARAAEEVQVCGEEMTLFAYTLRERYKIKIKLKFLSPKFQVYVIFDRKSPLFSGNSAPVSGHQTFH